MPVVGGRDGAHVALVLFWHNLGTEWRSSSAGGAEGASSPCLAEGFLFSLFIGSSAGEVFLPRETEGGQDKASSDLSSMGNVLVAAPLRDNSTASVPGRHT